MVGVGLKENRLLAKQMRSFQCFQLTRCFISNIEQTVFNWQEDFKMDQGLGHSNVLILNSGSFTVSAMYLSCQFN